MAVVGSGRGAVVLVAAASLFLSGCQTRPSADPTWWNPGTWFSGSEGRAVKRAQSNVEWAQSEVDDKREVLIKTAQKEAIKTDAAIHLADPSRPVEVASRSSAKTLIALSEAVGPVSAAERQVLIGLVGELVSENEDIRLAAEDRNRKAEDLLDDQVQQLVRSRKELAKLESKLLERTTQLEVAFVRENALANKYRNAKFIIIALAVLAVIVAIVAAYFRFTGMSAVGSLVSGIERFKSDSNPEWVESLLTDLSMSMNDRDKKLVRKVRSDHLRNDAP